MPSKYEIFGMVLLEALFFNLKVVTTLNGGSSMLIKDDNGVICYNENYDEWYKAITLLLSKEKNNKAKEDYSWDALVNSFISVYTK